MPQGEASRVLVWRLGSALLAARLEDVVEVVMVAADGRALSRGGQLEVTPPPGMTSPTRPPRAVVVRAGAGTMAMAADEVEGVKEYALRDSAPTPAWLRGLPTEHLAGLIHLEGSRVAALLALDTIESA